MRSQPSSGFPGRHPPHARRAGRARLRHRRRRRVDLETARALKSRGSRIIAYKGGNGIVISMEAMIAKLPRGDAERLFDHDNYDVIWITPQHVHTYKCCCETVYRCPVLEVPRSGSRCSSSIVRPTSGSRSATGPGTEPKRVGILDPNITVMKTSHLPMMVCETAYRQRRDRFAAIYVTNGLPSCTTRTSRASRAGSMLPLDGHHVEPRFVGRLPRPPRGRRRHAPLGEWAQLPVLRHALRRLSAGAQLRVPRELRLLLRRFRCAGWSGQVIERDGDA